MMRCPLTIRHAPKTCRPVKAWFIPGSDAAGWLAEVLRWNVDTASMTLYVLGESLNENKPAGLLVTLPTDGLPDASCRCQQYAQIAERLFLPVDAQLDPPVDDSKIADLLAGENDQYVLHPVLGLVRFGEEDTLSIVDLLRMPAENPTDWNWARTGTAYSRRLISVESKQDLSVDEVLSAGKGDIGTIDPITSGVPRRPSRRSRKRVPEQGHADNEVEASWLSRAWRRLFGDRFRRRTSPKRRGSENLRDKEIDRLTQLLNADPDEGLRYALPLAGSEAHRGRAVPSNRLPKRDVNFSWKLFSGTGPADPWVVSGQRYRKLCQRYRELANREVLLGRHRRAAYIFAHLLNDLASSASVLGSGGHFREAAIVYRDRLQRPLDAALCLEKGGWLAEAIDIYRECGRFEEVGDLYQKLGDVEQASAAYNRSIEQHLEKSGFTIAASLAEKKLNDPHRAIRLLAAGWPDSSQALLCLDETFRILGSLAIHEHAMELVEQMDPNALTDSAVNNAVRAIGGVASHYPDSDVRDAAADKIRVILGDRLSKSRDWGQDVLLDQLQLLAPRDRLLKRDCNRLMDQRRTRRAAVASRMNPNRDGLQLIGKSNLPDDVQWVAAVRAGKSFFAAGYREDAFVVGHSPGTASCRYFQSIQWPVAPGLCGAPVLLCPDLLNSFELFAQVVGLALFPDPKVLNATDGNPNAILLGPHPLATELTRAVAMSLDGWAWLVDLDAHSLILRVSGRDKRLIGSQTVALPSDVADTLPMMDQCVPLAVTRTHVFLGWQDCLVVMIRGIRVEFVRVTSPIRQICLPSDRFARYVVVRCDDTVFSLWYGRSDYRVHEVCEATPDTKCGLTDDDRLLVADDRTIRVFCRHARRFVETSGGSKRRAAPFAMLAGPHPDQILICYDNAETELLAVK